MSAPAPASCPKCAGALGPGARFCPSCGHGLTATSAGDPLIGLLLLGQFKILGRIGRGGWATVYAAEQRAMDRKVAVKVLHREFAGEEEAVRRFYREARAASKLNHPNILRPWLVGELDDGTPFLVMDLVDGVTLADELKQVGRLPIPRVLDIAVQISSALEEAADQGVVHRDLKPANVFLTTRGRRRDEVKLADFGIAKVLGEGEEQQAQLTRTGDVLGTPAYMSPEQALGKPVDGRSDLYALGTLIHRMVTGKVPFEEPTLMALLAAQVGKHAEPMSRPAPDVALPEGLQSLVTSLLAKSPSDRPASAGDVTHELLRLCRREGLADIVDPAGAAPPGGGSSLPPPARAVADRAARPVAEATDIGVRALDDPPAAPLFPAAPGDAPEVPVAQPRATLPPQFSLVGDSEDDMPTAVGREWPTIFRRSGERVDLQVPAQADLAAVASAVRSSGGPMPLAGTGAPGFSGDGGPAVHGQLCEPAGLGQDVHGNVFVVDRGNHCVRMVDSRDGTLRTVAGTPGESGFGGDDGPADLALLNEPGAIELDGAGNLYIADTGNRRVRAIDVRSGHIGTVVGSGRATAAMEGAPAHLAGVVPHDLAIGADGGLFIADAENHRVWRVDPTDGTLRTAAGVGAPELSGDGGPARAAGLSGPRGLAVGPDGALFIADTGNLRIRRIDPHTDRISTVAGGEDGTLGTPVSIAVTRHGDLRVADATAGRVLAVDPATGAAHEVAADLAEPRAVIVDGQGTLYIADAARHRVWAVIEPG